MEGQIMPDIFCAACLCKGVKSMSEHLPDGKQGNGYYCKACGSYEAEKGLTEEQVDSQISRRIVKRI